jgi:hypothetical protein
MVSLMSSNIDLLANEWLVRSLDVEREEASKTEAV